MLPTSERAIIAQKLRYDNNLTYQAIGDRLGISRQGAYQLVNGYKHGYKGRVQIVLNNGQELQFRLKKGKVNEGNS